MPLAMSSTEGADGGSATQWPPSSASTAATNRRTVVVAPLAFVGAHGAAVAASSVHMAATTGATATSPASANGAAGTGEADMEEPVALVAAWSAVGADITAARASFVSLSAAAVLCVATCARCRPGYPSLLLDP